SMVRSSAASSVTSHGYARARSISRSSVASRSPLRASIATAYPPCEKRRTMAAPVPGPTPVTTATGFGMPSPRRLVTAAATDYFMDDERHDWVMSAVLRQVKGDRGASEEPPTRVSKARAAQNRTQILTTAARLFRENGIRATGVDAISQGAGLTHGGFYSQFE